MRWFGRSWGAPVNEDGEQVPVPVGSACFRCGRLVDEDDQGVELPYAPPSGPLTLEPWHRACFLASLLGPTLAASLHDPVEEER